MSAPVNPVLPPAAGIASASPPSLWRPGLLLAFVAGVLLFTGLGAYPLLDQDESRYGQIPREMLESHDWLAPRMFGEIYTDKPPLLYWLVMGSYQLFGRSEFSARLPVALAAVVAVLTVFWLVARSRSVRAGWLAGLTLTTMLFGFALGRYLVLDGVLSTFVLLAAVMVLANLPRPPEAGQPEDPGCAWIGRRALWRSAVGYVFLGLAAMVKGPVAGILFGMPFVLYYVWLFGFRFWMPQLWWRLITGMYLWLGIPLTVAVALPWFLLMDKAHPGFLHEFFIVQNLARYAADTQSRDQPIWYFTVVAIAGLFPWVTFVPGMLARYFRAKGWQTLPARRPLVAFATLLALFPIAFFSTSHSKLIPYIASSFPGFAILLGLYFDELITREAAVDELQEVQPSAAEAAVSLTAARTDEPGGPPRIAAKILAVAAITMASAPLGYAYLLAYTQVPIHVRLAWPALVCFSLPMLAMAGLLLLSRRLSTRWIVAAVAGCMAAFLGLTAVSGFTQTLGLGLSHAALMDTIATRQEHDPRPLLVFKQHDEQGSFHFYHPHWQDLEEWWAADGAANFKPLENRLLALGPTRVIMKRKYLSRFEHLFGDRFEITVELEIGNSFELNVAPKPLPPAALPPPPPQSEP